MELKFEIQHKEGSFLLPVIPFHAHSLCAPNDTFLFARQLESFMHPGCCLCVFFPPGCLKLTHFHFATSSFHFCKRSEAWDISIPGIFETDTFLAIPLACLHLKHFCSPTLYTNIPKPTLIVLQKNINKSCLFCVSLFQMLVNSFET